VIGAILAETKSQAQRAAKLVKVTYEELEPIITISVNSVDVFIASICPSVCLSRAGTLSTKLHFS